MLRALAARLRRLFSSPPPPNRLTEGRDEGAPSRTAQEGRWDYGGWR
jgi:hypothetical protein